MHRLLLDSTRYKKYVMLDPLGVVTKTRQVETDQEEGKQRQGLALFLAKQ